MGSKGSILLKQWESEPPPSPSNEGPVNYGAAPPRPALRQCLEAVAYTDSLDWKDLQASEITKRVTSKVQPGSIVLFHNAALHTSEALPTIIETLLREGYSFVPISQIILPGPYAIDHTGRQCPAA